MILPPLVLLGSMVLVSFRRVSMDFPALNLDPCHSTLFSQYLSGLRDWSFPGFERV